MKNWAKRYLWAYRNSSEALSPLHLYMVKAERDFFVRKFRGTYLWMGVAAVNAFAVVDFSLTPDLAVPFLLARLAVVPVAVACWLAYRFYSVVERHYVLPAYLASAYMGLLTWFLTSRSGYESSFHFSCLLLIVTTMGAQIPWRRRHLARFYLLVAGPYWFALASRLGSGNRGLILANALFFAATVVLTMMFYSSGRSARRRDLVNRYRLELRNRRQKRVIEQKTREGIYLERLASQFSPQVIESIKSGTLDLESRSRREVACIFVDVQGSTARASRIDHRNYTELMAAFFQECVKIFLRHSVTVGTYLGDGILAFTNAPTESAAFRRNALEACLEIMALQERKRKIYFDTWRTDFNIRIGIDAGYATVGFFPSREHGTYTALGETVSLAARLCSRAEPNALAVTKRFLTSLKLDDSSLRIGRLATTSDIKGLEGEMFEVFSVRPPKAAEVPDTHCPSCQVAMERESEQLGASFYRCPLCQYRNLVTDKAEKKDLRRIA